jgi:hypothetical protein
VIERAGAIAIKEGKVRAAAGAGRVGKKRVRRTGARVAR